MSHSGSGWARRGLVLLTLITLIALAHAHRPNIGEQPEARVARRFQAQVSEFFAFAEDSSDKGASSALDLTLEDRTGQIRHLSSYRGRVVLLNFWASWCPPCLKEMPDLEGLTREMEGLPFSMVALSADENWGAIDQVLGSQKLHMEVYRDPTGQVKQHRRYGTEKLPETYVIDKEGQVRLRFISVQPWRDDELREYLEWLAQE